MTSYTMLYLNAKMEMYYGFANGSSRHTQNLDSSSWVLFFPADEIVSLSGIFLGNGTNNITKYNAVIGLLFDAYSNGIIHVIVYMYY